MRGGVTLARLEQVLEASGVPARLELRMPTGGRPRQLSVRALLVGVLLALADDRPAQLTRVHEALVSLSNADRRRLGVTVLRLGRVHTLTYRQVERTFSVMTTTMDPTPVPSFAGVEPEDHAAHLAAAHAGAPPDADVTLRAVVDLLCEASIPGQWRDASSSYAVDWTDHPAWSRPVAKGEVALAADPDAGWGHCKSHAPGDRDRLFFGWYAQAAVMVHDEGGPPVPELVRRVVLDAPSVDPPTAMAQVLVAVVSSGVRVTEVLADSGYSHRRAERWATPLRKVGIRLVQDLHPQDRGPKGAFEGAVCASGSLYCPCAPKALLSMSLPARDSSPEQIAAHAERCAELDRWRFRPICTDDDDGYHRVQCPAAANRVRCPLKPDSMALGFDRPEVTDPPTEPPMACRQATLTVPPTVNAATRQKHPYPSVALRLSYKRRTSSERAFSTIKDCSSTDVRRGSSRLFGRTKNLLMLTAAVVVRNLRVLDSFDGRRMEDTRRAAAGQPARTRRRRRTPLTDLPTHEDVSRAPAVIDSG
ncbi:MAG: hypothetical protein ACRDZR_12990 [Acidimicrobiales bacterium]